MAPAAVIRPPRMPAMVAQIAFAIPYYRNRDYLREAIESVRAQTVHEWELLVVDDAGPEPADQLVASYADSRMSYVRNPQNLGMTRNWNACLSLATAPLTTLLHQDDRLRPRYAERVVEAARRHPTAAAYFTDVRVIGPDGAPTTTAADVAKRLSRRPRSDHPVTGDHGLAAVLITNYIYCPSMCLNRAVVGPDPFDETKRMVQDLDFVARQLMHGQELRAIREELFDYRRHHDNQTESYTLDSTRFVEELELYRSIATATSERGWERSTRAARRRWMLRGHIGQKMLVDVATRRWPEARLKGSLLVEDLRGSTRPTG